MGAGLEDSKSQENYHGEHRLLQKVRQRVPGRNRNAERPSKGRSHRPRDQPRQRQRAEPSRLCGASRYRAAWPKRSAEGRDYLSVKLDDPSFNAPIYANLFDDEDGEGYTLIWSRGRKANGD